MKPQNRRSRESVNNGGGSANGRDENALSLVETFDDACARYAERVAFRSFGATLSYRELGRKADAFAAFLGSLDGLHRGDRVAIMLPNLLQFPVALFGVLKAGLIPTNVNPLYGARELEHQLHDSGARVIVAVDMARKMLGEVLSRKNAGEVHHLIFTGVGDLLGAPKSLLVNAATAPATFFRAPIEKRYTGRAVTRFRNALNLGLALRARNGLDGSMEETSESDELRNVALLQYTGGTTGLAKGAMLTHANLLLNIEQMLRVFPHLEDPKRDAEVITALPLYHIFSLTVNCLLIIRVGGCNTLIVDPRKTSRLIKTMKAERFNVIVGVNSLFASLLNHPKIGEVDFAPLRTTIAGGMATQSNVATRWRELTGCAVLQGYGLTETSPVISVNPPDSTEFDGGVGPPLPDTEISIRNERGEEAPRGEPGELFVRGPQVMPGYWRNPQETAQVLSADGWLHTGDVARVDERGYIHLVDRSKNVIIVSGFNVYPSEVESVLCEHPDIAEAACIGVEDAHSGQSVKAFVVEKRKGKLTEQEIVEYCRDQLANYKAPKAVAFLDALPKSHVGKVLHRKLPGASFPKKRESGEKTAS